MTNRQYKGEARLTHMITFRTQPSCSQYTSLDSVDNVGPSLHWYDDVVDFHSLDLPAITR